MSKGSTRMCGEFNSYQLYNSSENKSQYSFILFGGVLEPTSNSIEHKKKEPKNPTTTKKPTTHQVKNCLLGYSKQIPYTDGK